MSEQKQTLLLPKLDELCRLCKNEWLPAWDKCPDCHGVGYIPTPFGEQVLDLVRHHLRPIRRTED